MRQLFTSSLAVPVPPLGPSVRCGRCRSVMMQIHSEAGVRSVQAWYDCPVCHQRSLLSEPRTGARAGVIPDSPPPAPRHVAYLRFGGVSH